MEYKKALHRKRDLVLLSSFTCTFFMSYRLTTKLLLQVGLGKNISENLNQKAEMLDKHQPFKNLNASKATWLF